MPIEFDCNQCGKRLRTPDSTAGKTGKCPHCAGMMQIPLTSQQANQAHTATVRQPAPSPVPDQRLFDALPGEADVQQEAHRTTGEQKNDAFGGIEPLSDDPFQTSSTDSGLTSNVSESAAAISAPTWSNPPESSANPYTSPSTASSFVAQPAHRGQTVQTLGIVGLVLSILALFCICFVWIATPVLGLGGLVCGIISWVMANRDLRNSQSLDASGLSMYKTGRTLAIASVTVSVLSFVMGAAFALVLMLLVLGSG